MRALRIAGVGAALACLVGLGSVTVSPDNAQAGPGIEWSYNKEARGWVADPPGQSDPPPAKPPKPDPGDPGGYFYKTEAGLQKNKDNWFTWYCLPDKAPAVQGTGDSKDAFCAYEGKPGVNAVEKTCFDLWPPDTRPAIPKAKLRQHTDWIDGWKPGQGPDWDGKWDYMSWECDPITDDRWVPDEEIAKEIDYQIFQDLGEPKLEFRPGNTNKKALAHFPTVVWTDYPDKEKLEQNPNVRVVEADQDHVILDIRLEIEQSDGVVFVGYIRAKAEFLWKFQDGGVANGRGRPYTNPPSQMPPGHYLTNTFQKLGQKKVTLNVRWTGDVRVDPLGVAEPMKPVEVPVQEETLEVVESRPVLGN